jgi:hypothetical protein
MLIRDHPTRGRVQPDSRGVPFRDAVEPAPGGQEDLGDRVFRVARGGSAPAAVGGDVRPVTCEQLVELAFRIHGRIMSGRQEIV